MNTLIMHAQKLNYGSYVYPRVGAMPVMYHPLYRTEAMGIPAPQIFNHYAPISPTTCMFVFRVQVNKNIVLE
jgi:hypothetical protein